jgi:Putative beta-barrel porin-2, OmpL-like. bbp2
VTRHSSLAARSLFSSFAITAFCVAAFLGKGLAQQATAPKPLSGAVAADSPEAPPGPNDPISGCGAKAQESFFPRLVDTYKEHLHYWDQQAAAANAPSAPAAANAEPAYRGAPPPEDSPPFPYSTWPIGGTSAIGYSGPYASYSTPLMDTLYCGPYGNMLKASRIQIFGWLNPGANASTSNNQFRIGKGASPLGASASLTGAGGNNPVAYDVYPNTIQLDQFTLYIQRSADEVQTDHFDWGFRFANLYGTDYKYTFSHDILSNQYIRSHNQYGYDPVMAYVDLYFPHVAEGMNIRIGRYISLPDIEAQLAPDNLTASHSLLYTVDPYTQTGIVDTIRWTRNWTTQLEFSGGNDVAPWDTRNVKPTPAFCVSWTSDSGHDNIYPCINGLNGGSYAYNNIQHLVLTWYHKFDDKGFMRNWHSDTETYFMWERFVPNLNNPNHPPLINNANGAFCPPSQTSCTAPEYAIVNYLEYRFMPNAFFTFRNEYYNDFSGQRTGFKTQYSEHFVGVTYWLGDVITIRPGLRFDYAYNVPVFDNASKHGQFTAEIDTIFHY